MRGFIGVILLLLVLRPGSAAPASSPVDLGPGTPKLRAWDPGESGPGKEMADPRLDRPVAFWRAGISLSDVFASIQDQAGVRIAFPPQDTWNPRVRLTLYLSPKQPPSLRELMAQLAWVTDSSFACTIDENRTYYLIGPANTPPATPPQAEENRPEPPEPPKAEMAAKAAARFELYRAALGLSREEAIRRYRKVDDRLLLATLYQPMRAMTQFIASLSEQDRQTLFSHTGVTKAWSELSPEQQSLCRQAFGGPSSASEIPPDLHVAIAIGMHSSHGIDMSAYVETADRGLVEMAILVGPPAVSDDEPLNAYEAVELRRLLGEKMTDEQAQKLADEVEEKQREAQGDKDNRALRARMLLEPALSAQAREKLQAASAQWEERRDYALWQVQEGVAARTGMNVVSDCFYQPVRRIQHLDALDPEYAAELRARLARGGEWLQGHPHEPDIPGEDVPAGYLKAIKAAPRPLPLLDWLTALCHPEWTRAEVLDNPGGNPAGWEWGDAGSFLRFRSTFRDVCRAALAGDDALRSVDALFDDQLKPMLASGKLREISIRLDVDTQIGLVSRMTDLQAGLGLRLIYEDPADRAGAARQSLRLFLSRLLEGHVAMVRLLATLTDQQWKLLIGPGLNCKQDLTPAQQELAVVQEPPGVVGRPAPVGNAPGVVGDGGGEPADSGEGSVRAVLDASRKSVSPHAAVASVRVTLSHSASEYNFSPSYSFTPEAPLPRL